MQTRLLTFAALIAIPAALRAAPSGLNNIPTADVIGKREVVLQAFDLVGSGPHDFWVGFRSGIDLSPIHVEWGLDSHLAPTPAGPLYFQTKLRVLPWKGAQFAVGVANVPLTNQDRAGDPFTYAVLTQDLEFVRVSVGYGLQPHNNTLLLGLDRTFKIKDHELDLRVDLAQTNDESGWLPAIGLKYQIWKPIILETWVNLPSQGDASVALRLNYAFKF